MVGGRGVTRANMPTIDSNDKQLGKVTMVAVDEPLSEPFSNQKTYATDSSRIAPPVFSEPPSLMIRMITRARGRASESLPFRI